MKDILKAKGIIFYQKDDTDGNNALLLVPNTKALYRIDLKTNKVFSIGFYTEIKQDYSMAQFNSDYTYYEVLNDKNTLCYFSIEDYDGYTFDRLLGSTAQRRYNTYFLALDLLFYNKTELRTLPLHKSIYTRIKDFQDYIKSY